MGRLLILQNLTLACALAITLAGSPAHAGEVYSAKLHDYQLQFPSLNGDLAQGKDRSAVDLEVHFKSSSNFSPDQVGLALNGLMCNADLAQMRAVSHWERRDDEYVLVIEIDRLRFGNQEEFRDKLEAILQYNGALVLAVRSPVKIKAARLHFFAPSRRPPPPEVRLDSVSPPGPVIRTPNLKFSFSSPNGATRFECKHSTDEGAWEPCTSPKTYSGLRNGEHRFKFRAIDAGGKHGRAVRYVVQVAAPRPAVVITRVDPPENPTTSTTIAIYFDKHGHGGIECRLDSGNWAHCRSPFQAKNLADGEHSASFRAMSWIYQCSWGKWLGRYRWFQLLWPAYTEPVIYTWRVAHSQVPTVQIVAGPSEITNATSARFEFRSPTTSTFRCSLDGNALVECTSPWEYTGLAEGRHEFAVTPYLGNLTGTPGSYVWTVDRTRPVLTLGTVSPSVSPTSSTSLTLTFSVSEPAVTSCSLDGAAGQACSSPVQVVSLSEGAHRLAVSAVDNAGNVSDPLVYEWVVDRTAPDVAVRMTFPASTPTSSTRAVFELSSTSTAVGFRCSLDGAVESACASPVEYTGLADGRHELVVVSVDAAGNASAPGSAQWDVDTAAPVITLGAAVPPENPTSSRSIELPFNVSETASVTCELDFGGQVPCRSPFVAAGLADGNHAVELIAVDGAGNVSAAARYNWSVRTVAITQILGVTPSGSRVSSTSLLVSFGSSTAVSFECALDRAAFAACRSPASLSGLAEGAHHFGVRGLNSYGEAGPEAGYDWAVDTSGPVVVLGVITPSESPTASSSRSIAFSSADAASFLCSLDGAAEAVCVSPYVVSGAGEGSHRLSIVGVDSVGNRGNATTHAWVVDQTGPVVAFTGVNPAGAVVSSTSLTASFSAGEPATFVCRLDGGAEAGCFSPHTVSVGEGSHTLSVTGIDALGNRGAAVTHAWAVDTTGPIARFDSISPAGSPTALLNLTAAFSANEPGTFKCSLDGAAEVACGSPYTVAVGEGSHTLSVVAIDLVGNRGAAISHAWSVDVTGPVVTIGAFSPAVSPTSSTSFSASFSANESATFKCSLDGAAEVACASPYSGTVGEGAHSIAIAGIDSLGNRGASASRSWTVDSTGPVVTIGAFSPATSPSSQLSFSASFSANESATFKCSLDGAAESACTSPAAGSVGEGSHTFSVAGVDSLGNRGATVSHAWTVSVPQATASITGQSPSADPTNVTSRQFTFSGANASYYQCSLDGLSYTTCSSPINYSGLGNGSHSFSVRGVNSLDIPGSPSSVSWTVDTVAPTVTILSTTPGWTPTSQTTLTATFSTSEAASTFCQLDGGLIAGCTSPHTVTVSGGLHSLNIYAVDVVGNQGPWANYTWTVDTSALTISSLSVSSITSTTAQLSWTTNLPANSRVRYGTTPAMTQSTAVDPAFVTSHSMALTGLGTFTFYYVQAVSVDRDGREVSSNVVTFRTLR